MSSIEKLPSKPKNIGHYNKNFRRKDGRKKMIATKNLITSVPLVKILFISDPQTILTDK